MPKHFLLGIIRYFSMERTLVDPLSLLAGPVLAYWWAIALEPSWHTHAAHVEHVRALRAGRERAEAALRQPACPHCGGTLDEYVYKTGVHIGQAFQGCTRFPACRYRVDLPAR